MISDGLNDEMRRSGIFIHRHTSGLARVVLDLHSKKKNVTLVCGDTIYGADVVNVAAGRVPNMEDIVVNDNGVTWSGNTKGMGLDERGIKLTSRGHIVVDKYQNTNVKSIFAIG